MQFYDQLIPLGQFFNHLQKIRPPDFPIENPLLLRGGLATHDRLASLSETLESPSILHLSPIFVQTKIGGDNANPILETPVLVPASKSGPVSGAAEKVDADLLRQVSMMTEALRNRTNQATATIDDQMKERFLAAAADAAHEFRIRQGLKRGRLPLIIGRNATGFSRHRLQPALKTDQHAKQHTDAATANFVRSFIQGIMVRIARRCNEILTSACAKRCTSACNIREFCAVS